MVKSRSSTFVKVTSAAPGASSRAGVSRSRVLPEPCGPYTPAVRSNGTHSGPVRGTLPTPSRQPTDAGVNFSRPPAVLPPSWLPAGVCVAPVADAREDRRRAVRASIAVNPPNRVPARPYRSGRMSPRTRRRRPAPRMALASARVAMPCRRPVPTVVQNRATAQMLAASSSSSRTPASAYTRLGDGTPAAASTPTPTRPVSRPPRAGNSRGESGQSHPRPVKKPAAPWATSSVAAARDNHAKAAPSGTSQPHGSGSGRRRAMLSGLIPR